MKVFKGKMRLHVFISQPMKGKTKEEIEAERAAAVRALERAGHTVAGGYMDSGAPDGVNEALWYLGQSILILAGCDVLLYLGEWQVGSFLPRGCRVEMECAERYGIPVYMGEVGLVKLCQMGLGASEPCAPATRCPR